MLENKSLMMKRYFGKEAGIDKTSNLNTSNDKELIDLTEKKIILKTYFKPFNLGEGTSSDPAKIKLN